MSRLPTALASLALGALSRASAQEPPGRPARGPEVKVEYDALTDSTTRSLSAYAVVDTSLAPPDTFAVELSQRWKGRGAVAPVAAVELGLGRTRAEGLRASGLLRPSASRPPTVVLLLDGARRIRLEQSEYVSNAGGRLTFETARYRMSPAELRLVAGCRALRVWVGGRELWIDPAWRGVAADMVAGQTPAGALPVRKAP